MDGEHGQETARKRATADPAPQQAGAEGPAPDLGSVAPEAVLSSPASGGRGNTPVRAAAVQRMQQTYGNRATRRFLQRRPAGATPVQRDTTPDVPSYTLTTPAIGQPDPQASRYHLDPKYQLTLDPAIQAQIDLILGTHLQPGNVLDTLQNLKISLPPPQQTPATSTTPAQGTPPANPPGTGGAPSASPAPHPGSIGDLIAAVGQVGIVKQELDKVKTLAQDKLKSDWGRLRTGEKVGVVSSLAVIGLGALGGALHDPAARQLLLGQINGKILPVPGVDWLKLETNLGGNNLMLGFHVDVGALLPKNLGFGPGSPGALGGPPNPQPFTPGAHF